jgi:hypothetical protein
MIPYLLGIWLIITWALVSKPPLLLVVVLSGSLFALIHLVSDLAFTTFQPTDPKDVLKYILKLVFKLILTLVTGFFLFYISPVFALLSPSPKWAHGKTGLELVNKNELDKLDHILAEFVIA